MTMPSPESSLEDKESWDQSWDDLKAKHKPNFIDSLKAKEFEEEVERLRNWLHEKSDALKQLAPAKVSILVRECYNFPHMNNIRDDVTNLALQELGLLSTVPEEQVVAGSGEAISEK